jgi:hypothetical protein
VLHRGIWIPKELASADSHEAPPTPLEHRLTCHIVRHFLDWVEDSENDAGVRGSAIDGLRKRETIRVILHAYSPPQPGLKVAVKGLAV